MTDERRPLHFDDALPTLVNEVVEIVGRDALILAKLIILRDVVGALTVVIRDDKLLNRRSAISERLRALWPYADEDPVATPDELFDNYLNEPDAGYREAVKLSDGSLIDVRVVDRRLVGADWQRAPGDRVSETPVAVFWSLKGGVGRSTALCVAAATLARLGYNILALDLDLEAPGIGDMLLSEDDRPQYGALDFFVENGFGTVDDFFLREMIAPSRLNEGRGLISVVPATGRATERFPQNTLAKLARAYIDKQGPSGSLSFLDQTRDLVSRLTRLSHYDAVLVDARAGLNESTPASVLGLGGLVLLFGVATPQTFRGYRSAFAHLNRFIVSGADNIWRERLQMVHAKAATLKSAEMSFRDDSFDLFSDWIYDEAAYDRPDAFNFDLDDVTAPHFPWPILHDANFLEFDPIAHPDQLTEEPTIRTFGEFVDRLARALWSDTEIENKADLRF